MLLYHLMQFNKYLTGEVGLTWDGFQRKARVDSSLTKNEIIIILHDQLLCGSLSVSQLNS